VLTHVPAPDRRCGHSDGCCPIGLAPVDSQVAVRKDEHMRRPVGLQRQLSGLWDLCAELANGGSGGSGEQGPPGLPGPAGPQGEQGPPGVAGADGAAGAPGPQGETGLPGADGPAGADGAQGPAGPQGPAGADSTVPGPAGPAGSQGEQGLVGAQGPQGETGAAGPAGDTGPEGPQGQQGIQGIPGADGQDGAAGADGVPGPASIAVLNFHADATANLTLTNQANAEQGLGNSNRNETKFDGSNFTQVRVAARIVTAGAATARLYPQFSTDGSAFTTIGSGTGGDSASMAAPGAVASGWINLPAGAKADVVFRIAQNGGNGTADPALGSVALQFK
jgi:hypothetical protein